MERVRFRDCSCPGTPHDGLDGRDDGDYAFLRPALNFEGGAAAFRAIRAAQGNVERLSELVGPIYLRFGVTGWNLVDGDGAPVPVDPDYLVNELPYQDAFALVDKADDLYGSSVLAPLAKRIAAFSNAGRTGDTSTSATRRPSPARRSRSARSSTARASRAS